MSKIQIENVSFHYDTTLVLDQINMEIQSGDFVCLLGESGCGKSTFLRLMAGLAKPDSGEITIDGKPVKAAGLDRSIVFQDYSLFPWFTTGKNILLALQQKFPKEDKKKLFEKITFYLREAGLSEDILNKYPSELSGGMRQRCAICRAFALDSPIMLMDEPFGALDAVTRARLQDMTLALWRRDLNNRKTIMFVTHDVDEALLLATKIYIFGLKPSKIIYTHQFGQEKFMDRERLFENKDIIELRNKLIQILNKDVGRKINRQI